jgi:hypothetical protein
MAWKVYMIVCVSAITCQYTGDPARFPCRQALFSAQRYCSERTVELRSAYRSPPGGLWSCSPVCGSTRTATGWTETSPLVATRAVGAYSVWWEKGVRAVPSRGAIPRTGSGPGLGATNATLLVCPALGNLLADVTVRCRSGVFYFLVASLGGLGTSMFDLTSCSHTRA